MKEIILHETPRQNGHIVLTTLAGTTITVDNILGIINKTTGKVVYTPLKYGTISVGTVVLSDGTYQEITFGQDIPTQPDNSQFFIKIYTDEEGGGGELELMTDAEYAPALSELGDMIDALDEES